MTNEFEGYLAVTSLLIELEQKLKVFWNGGEQGFTKQASKLIKKNNLKKCVHIVKYTNCFCVILDNLIICCNLKNVFTL